MRNKIEELLSSEDELNVSVGFQAANSQDIWFVIFPEINAYKGHGYGNIYGNGHGDGYGDGYGDGDGYGYGYGDGYGYGYGYGHGNGNGYGYGYRDGNEIFFNKNLFFSP